MEAPNPSNVSAAEQNSVVPVVPGTSLRYKFNRIVVLTRRTFKRAYLSTHHLHIYLDILNLICLTPYEQNKSQKVYLNKTRVIKKIVFWSYTFLAILPSVFYTLHLFSHLLIERAWNETIHFGFYLSTCLIQIYFTYFLAFQQDLISKLLTGFDDYETKSSAFNDADLENSPVVKKTTYFAVLGYMILSILISITKTILAQALPVPDHPSDVFAPVGMLLWSPWNSLHWTDYLFVKIFATIANLCWNVQVDSIRDLILMTAIVNKNQVLKLGRKVRECLIYKQTNFAPSDHLLVDMVCWKVYHRAVKVNALTNGILERLLKLNIVNSVMGFSLLWILISNKESILLIVLYGLNLAKFVGIIFIARIASAQNTPCCKWIRTLSSKTVRHLDDKDKYQSDRDLLHDLKENPMGLGKGKFHIDDKFAFILVFFGLVGSLVRLFIKDSKSHERDDKDSSNDNLSSNWLQECDP